VDCLKRLALFHGLSIIVDDGAKFCGKTLDAMGLQAGSEIGFYPTGKPVKNGYIEMLQQEAADECLNSEIFFTLEDVR